ncbi:hypothetical protein [Salinirussus salinus]|uniref:hypothetical protein n=1 Tax=Salinirussus salinus TaxID=1198300 RepID=UPI00135BDFF8|nr:hypothetical protein [Salinirussus salinus]
MRVEVHFEDGPISADIEAEDGDDFCSALDELAEFVSDYHQMVNGDLQATRFDWEGKEEQVTWDEIEDDGSSSEAVEEPESHVEEPVDEAVTGDTEQDSGTEEPDEDDESDEYRLIAEETGLDKNQLKKVIEIGDSDSGPRILASNFLPGDSKREKTLNASVVLLTLWSSVHDVFWRNTVDIVDDLEQSGLKDDRFKRIYNHSDWEKYLQKKGEKRGTELGIVPLGQDRGYELIKEMADNAGV